MRILSSLVKTTSAFWCALSLFSGAVYGEDSLLRFKPRERESVYTWYSQAETLMRNGTFERFLKSSSQAYVSMSTLKVLDNDAMIQRVGISAGSIVMNDQVRAHPAIGTFLEYIQEPTGAVPKAVGNGMQFSVKNMQMMLPEEAVSIGTTWTQTIAATPGFPVETEIRYQVVNQLGNLIIIRSKSDLERHEVMKGMFYTLKGSAQIIFNVEAGMILRNESSNYVEVAIERSGVERFTKMNLNSILELQF